MFLTGTITHFMSLQHNPQILQAGEEIANCQLFVVCPQAKELPSGLGTVLQKLSMALLILSDFIGLDGIFGLFFFNKRF